MTMNVVYLLIKNFLGKKNFLKKKAILFYHGKMGNMMESERFPLNSPELSKVLRTSEKTEDLL